ncbi:hypothetical protein GW17_00039072 [Ensete ventricosum]|nr:hypothetical protein GW17_00039072 [Ensete ventricosum]
MGGWGAVRGRGRATLQISKLPRPPHSRTRGIDPKDACPVLGPTAGDDSKIDQGGGTPGTKWNTSALPPPSVGPLKSSIVGRAADGELSVVPKP